MSVKNKLGLLSGILLVAIIIVGIIAYMSSKSWSTDLTKLAEERVPGMLYLGTLDKERMVIRSQTLEVLTLEFEYNSQSKFSDIAKQRTNSWKIIDENWEKFVALPRASERGRQASC